MYLKSLELYGFKSFAKRTKISFPPHIAAVVGPNGSGKSNISDAILWALGETSAKLLRGSKMEDIIFGGTTETSSLSFAEVILYFDNRDQYFSLPYEEVSVSRKLYRSGESEFRINNQKVRLKDIHELFLDTGVGRDGYSLISQGQIDRILSNRPEERRSIFEEAIGISKYKLRKDTSTKSLKDTEENIIRIEDILSEIEIQEEKLRGESEIAKQYRSIQRKREGTYGKLLYARKAEYQKNHGKILAKRDSIKENLAQAKKSREKLQSQIINLEEKEREIDLTIDHIREEDLTRVKDIETIKSRINQSHISLSHLNTRFEENKNQLTKSDLEINEIRRLLAEGKKILLGREEQLKSMLEDRKVLEKELKTIEENLREIERTQFDQESALRENLNKKSELEGKITSGNFILREKRERLDILRGRLHDTESMESELQEEQNRRERELLAFQTQITKMEENLKVLREEKIEIETAISEKAKQLQELDAKFYKKNQDLTFLKRIYENNEGYFDNVRNFLSFMKKNQFYNDEIIGPVADHISIQKDYEVAIATALGNNAQNIIIKDEKYLSEITSIIKKNHFGRITFYPITSMKKREIVEDVRKFTNISFKESLSYIEYNPVLHPVLSNLLGRILIVDSVEEGRKLSADLNKRYRIVTKEGEIFQIGGSITVGQSKQIVKNLYNREERISSLEQEIFHIQEGYNNLTDETHLLQEKVQKITDHMNVIENGLKQLNDKYNRGLLVLDTIKNSLEKNRETKNNYIESIESEVGSITEIEGELEVFQSNLSKIQNWSEKNDTSSHRDISKKFNTYKQRENKLNLEINTMELEIKTIKKERDENSRKGKLIEERKIELSKIIDEIKTSIEQENHTIINLTQEREQAEANAQIISLKLSEMGAQKREIENEFSKCKELEENIFEEILSLNREEEKWDNRWSQFQYEQHHLISELEDWEEKFPNYTILLDEEDTEKSLERTMKKFDKKIQSFGFVNMNSIEEYEEVSSRVIFLREQKNDLQEAKEDLEKVISKLEREMKSLFEDGLKEIQQNFKEIFEILFQGGRAELKLVDEHNSLSSGIEIIVQPPGKKAQSLSLLSGGERAMTAVALLFALLRMNRPPFVILDEIDATLDEANINRYTSYLKNLEDIQFLMITHRKPTMEIADRIYGVTMENDGISKIYTMKLEGDEDNARMDEK